MGIIATSTAPESKEAALVRLAKQARLSGVKLFQDPKDGRFYASSRSQPGTFHRLTGFSCSCQGFVRHGRCSHLAAFHSALGWIDPEPETPAPAACGECGGSGEVTGTVGCGRGWRYDSIVCTSCHGTGTVQVAA